MHPPRYMIFGDYGSHHDSHHRHRLKEGFGPEGTHALSRKTGYWYLVAKANYPLEPEEVPKELRLKGLLLL